MLKQLNQLLQDNKVFINCDFFSDHTDWVKCSNSECPYGLWYHQVCKDLDGPPADDQDWWCCQECHDSGTSVFCVCKRVSDGDTVRCANGANCMRGLIFHTACIGDVIGM